MVELGRLNAIQQKLFKYKRNIYLIKSATVTTEVKRSIVQMNQFNKIN